MAYVKNSDVRVAYRYTYNNGISNTDITGEGLTTNTKIGTAVPKFRSLIKSRANATSNYSLVAINVRDLYPFGYKCKQMVFSPPNTFVSDSLAGWYFDTLPAENSLGYSSVDAQALGKAYKSLAASQTHAKGMEFLGELHKTIVSLKRPFGSVRDLVNQYVEQISGYHHLLYRPGTSVLTKRRLLKTAGDSWLEVAFGIKPLLNDVKEIAEAIARHNVDKRRDYAVGVAESILAASPIPRSLIAPYRSISLYKTGIERREVKVKYRAALDWSRSSDLGSNQRLIELSGFSPDRFIPTLWELLPWSWLVDYFVNAGQVLETGCQSQSAVTWCVQTVHRLTTRELIISGEPTDPASVITFSGSPGRVKLIKRNFTRVNYTALPNVPVQFSIPGRPNQYANVVSAWLQRLKF